MDLENQPQFQAQQPVFKGLYADLEPKIWVVKITADLPDKTTLIETRTAFAVHKDGFLLTAYHGDWHNWGNHVIKVRTLVGPTAEFVNEATVVAKNPRCDLCLLQIKNRIEVDVVQLGAGNLDVCQIIMAIGHPYSCVGSGLIGRVLYPCTVNPEFEFDDSQEKACRNFPVEEVEKTLSYRIMGHVSNVSYYDENKELAYVRGFQATTPIIQASGLVGGGGEGCAGAPIFNLKGEIVGMFLFGMDGYDIGLHRTVIKRFVDEYIWSLLFR